MDLLLRSLNINDFEIINEITAKVREAGKISIFKLIPYSSVTPYLKIQNKGGSSHIARIYKVEHFYIDELGETFVRQFVDGRKFFYAENKSLYLAQFEYIDGVQYSEYFYYNGEIPLSYMSKLFIETFTGLNDIHSIGYYHGDLGSGENIILEGTINNWRRVVIIDIEGDKITNQQQIDDDIRTLAFMLWTILLDDIKVTLTYDTAGEIIHYKHPMFIDLVKSNFPKNEAYIRYMDALLWIFIDMPTINKILDRLNSL